MASTWTGRLEGENCDTGTHPSVVQGETLATYRWPAVGEPRALALLLHGFRAHACYNFTSDGGGTKLMYGDAASSSFVRELNQRGVLVQAHDHVGHGRSTGLRAYFPSIDALVADTAAHVERLRAEYPALKLFLVGHSLGGTLSMRLALDHPQLIDGMCLSSAACEPPANMLGAKGMVLASISSVLSAVIPKVEVIAIPSPDGKKETSYERFLNNPLNSPNVNLRARVGRQFLVAYRDIAARKAAITTPVLAYSGEHDTLVNPQATTRLIDAVASEDKAAVLAKGRWHNLLVEDGMEEIWQAFADWIVTRCQ